MIIICLVIIGMSFILGAPPSDDYHLSSNNWDGFYTWAHPSDDYHLSSNNWDESHTNQVM